MSRRIAVAAGAGLLVTVIGSGVALASTHQTVNPVNVTPVVESSTTDPAGGPDQNVQQGDQTGPDTAGSADAKTAEAKTAEPAGATGTDPAGGPNDNVQQGDQTGPDTPGVGGE